MRKDDLGRERRDVEAIGERREEEERRKGGDDTCA